MKVKIYALFWILILALGCSSNYKTTAYKTYEPITYLENMPIFYVDELLPESSEVIGELKVGDLGKTSRCTFEMVMARAELEAKQIGGNALKLTRHKGPDMMSTCHRIKAQILRLEEVEKYQPVEKIEPDWDYSLLHIRRYSGAGALVSYKIRMGDSTLCRIFNDDFRTIKIYKEGTQKIWAKTESRTEIDIDFEHGKEYFLSCGLELGIVVGRPIITEVPWRIGRLEFKAWIGTDD